MKIQSHVKEVAPRLLANWEALTRRAHQPRVQKTEFEAVRTFWIGPRLPDFHSMCLRSWLALGYRVELFSYAPVENLPNGVFVRDAAEVMPRSWLFDDAPSLDKKPATRANIFRLAMLAKDLGPWSDADYLMLRPLPKARDILIGRESNGLICNAILWVPPDFEMLERIVRSFRARDTPPWSISTTYKMKLSQAFGGREMPHLAYPKHHWGRSAIYYFIMKYNLYDQVQPYQRFYWPLMYDDRLYRSETPFEEIVDNPEVCGVHFFYAKDHAFQAADDDSFIGWAKKKFL
ncbi:MAG: hypothetical protein AAGM38_06675 [Pseudomonadota bacterium]